MRLFRKAKAVVGLDIGSSAVKAVELKPVGKGYQGRRVRLRSRSAGCHRRRRDHRCRRRRRRHPAHVRRATSVQERKDVCASLSGNAVIVKKITLPVMTETELERVDLLGGGAVHPVRHPGRQPRLPDPGRRHRARFARQHGSAAGRREEGKDRRLHQRDRPGRPNAGHRRRRRIRAAERVRSELRPRARRRSWCC